MARLVTLHGWLLWRRQSKPWRGGRQLWAVRVCHFHYLREAALTIYEADRHAKVQFKKKVRDVRPIERKVEGRDADEAEAVRGYCAGVRCGRP